MRRSIPLIILLAASFAFAAQRSPQWHDPANWRKLEKKMTTTQVTRILGRPAEQETVGKALFYFYQSPVRDADGSLADLPEYGFVRFTTDPRSRDTRRPSYIMTGYKPVNIDLLQQLEPPLHDPPVADSPEPITDHQSKIETSQSPVITTPKKPETQTQTVIRQPRRVRKTQSPPPARETAADIHTKKSSHLFFYIGGFAFACAVIITFLKNKTEGFGHR